MRNVILGAVFLTIIGSVAAPAEESGDAAGGASMEDSQFDRDSINSATSLDATEAAPTVGEALAEALQSKNATRIELTIRCEQYVLALTVFDDGSFKATDMQDELIDKAALASAQAALPMLTVIDTGCPED
jgi:hypothetical protein